MTTSLVPRVAWGREGRGGREQEIANTVKMFHSFHMGVLQAGQEKCCLGVMDHIVKGMACHTHGFHLK